jgi:flagellar biosynthesis protein FlhF
MVKDEFGANAMIISSKKDKKRGFMGFRSRPVIEVTAALDVKRQEPSEPRPARTERVEEVTNTGDEFRRAMLAPLARELKELRDRVETLTSREPDEGRQSHSPDMFRSAPGPEIDRAPAAAYDHAGRDDDGGILFSSLWDKAVAMADDGDAAPAPVRRGGRDDALVVLEAQLRAQGVGEKECAALIGALPASAGKVQSKELMRELFREAVSSHVRCSGPVRVSRNTRNIMALVGPTGVGKTTTIAKLAAIACKQGAKVALITIDTFRIGAVDQLKTYSSIMKIPLKVASTPQELKAAIDGFADRNLVLIDTAGRSPRDKARLQEMKKFLGAHPEIETHLCLSSTTREKELHHSIERFGVLPVTRLLFTKLDESESFGCIVNTQMRETLPLSYFTTGQRVPEDIEIATTNRLADLVIREMKS